MNPLSLVPSPDSVPVEWGWFKFFLILTFLIHIVLMNIMVGTGFIAWVNSFRQNSKKNLIPLQKDIAAKLPVVIALVINFGIVPFLFLQVLYGQFIYVSSQLMAVYWLSAIGLMLIAYYSAYYYKFNFDKLKSQKSLFIGIAVILFMIIGFLFTNNMTLMLNPKTWLKYFTNSNGTLLNLDDPVLIPRFLHFMTASVALGGLFIAIVWTLKQKKDQCFEANQYISLGMKWFSYATILQIFIGFWFQLSLPKPIMNLFLGTSLNHTALFILSLALLVQTLYFSLKNYVWPTAFSVLLLVFTMIIMRDEVRTVYLNPYFKVSDLDVTGQYSSFIFFAVCLAVTIAIVLYVLGLAVKVENNILQNKSS